MAELRPDQLSFLAAHGIPLSCVFDASGMRKPEYHTAMTELGMSFAYGVNPCNKAGHTLRTRAGHCIQCDHAKIAYMMRHDAAGTLYIAATATGKLIKIGSTNDLSTRQRNLNVFRYGGSGDWQVLATARCPTAGRVECAVHSRLSRYSVPGEYNQGGRRRRCYELFRCNFSDARDAIRAELPRGAQLVIPNEERAVSAFAFR